MNEDKILQKLTEHDRRFDKLESGFFDFKNQFLTAQDEILTIIRRLDQERVFATNWVARIENEIARIKEVLKIK